jgi:hypothetical protein
VNNAVGLVLFAKQTQRVEDNLYPQKKKKNDNIGVLEKRKDVFE